MVLKNAKWQIFTLHWRRDALQRADTASLPGTNTNEDLLMPCSNIGIMTTHPRTEGNAPFFLKLGVQKFMEWFVLMCSLGSFSQKKNSKTLYLKYRWKSKAKAQKGDSYLWFYVDKDKQLYRLILLTWSDVLLHIFREQLGLSLPPAETSRRLYFLSYLNDFANCTQHHSEDRRKISRWKQSLPKRISAPRLIGTWGRQETRGGAAPPFSSGRCPWNEI